MSSSNNKCSICEAYGWDYHLCCLNASTRINNRKRGSRGSDHTVCGAEEGSRPTKRQASVQTDDAPGPMQGPAQPEANPTILFIMMKKFKEEAELWESLFHASEKDNQGLRNLAGSQQESIDRLITEVNVVRAVNDVLWERNEHQHATLVAIGQRNPDVAREYLPWMAAATPPLSPDTIDLTEDDE